jgi:hypothetical protein
MSLRDKLAIVALALLLVMPFSTIAVAEDEEETRVGEKSKYDYWMDMEGYVLDGEVTLKVERLTELLGMDVYELSWKGDGDVSGSVMGTFDMDIDSYYEKTSRALVREQGYIEITTKQAGITYKLKTEMTHTYMPPLDLGDYPVELNEKWNATSTRSYTMTFYVNGMLDSQESDLEDVTYEMECIGEKTITVEAGTYTGFEIKRTKDDGTYGVDVYKPGMGNILSEEFEENGTKFGSMELISYSKGDEAEAIPSWIWILAVVLIIVIVAAIAGTLQRGKRQAEMEQERYSMLEREEPPRT